MTAVPKTEPALSPAEAKASVSLGDLERSVGFVMRIAQLTAFENLFEELGPTEVRISEFTVLVAIAENPGVRQGVIADVLKIKWSNMTKVVRALETRGLVERHVPPNDRRSVMLRVTDGGREQIERSAAKMYRSDRQALAMLSDEEHAHYLALSRKIAGWPSQAPEDSRR